MQKCHGLSHSSAVQLYDPNFLVWSPFFSPVSFFCSEGSNENDKHEMQTSFYTVTKYCYTHDKRQLESGNHVSGRNEKSKDSHSIHCQKGLLKRNTKSWLPQTTTSSLNFFMSTFLVYLCCVCVCHELQLHGHSWWVHLHPSTYTKLSACLLWFSRVLKHYDAWKNLKAPTSICLNLWK